MPIYLPPVGRREFLTGAAAGALGLVWSRQAEAASRRQDVWALFSDTHVAGDPGHEHSGVNLTQNLARAVREALADAGQPAGVLIDGDCAFRDGQAADYTQLGMLLDPLRQAGLPVHMALGNHDDRAQFRARFSAEADGQSALVEHQVAVIETERVNWFLLDSLESTNVTPGKLGEAQIAWLAAELDKRPDRPAVVLGHHHPVEAANGGSGLKDTAALFAELVPRRQVKAYVFGHTHHWGHAERDGIHLVNLPPTAYPFVKQDPNGWVRCELAADGATFELRAFDEKHRAHGQRLSLPWRSAG